MKTHNIKLEQVQIKENYLLIEVKKAIKTASGIIIPDSVKQTFTEDFHKVIKTNSKKYDIGDIVSVSGHFDVIELADCNVMIIDDESVDIFVKANDYIEEEGIEQKKQIIINPKFN